MTHPVTSAKVYIAVWAALIALTVATTLIAEVDLGEYNFVVAITIAVIKALLVMLFFMHVKGSRAVTKLFVAAGFFWMAILFVFTLSDYMSRGWLPAGSWWRQ
jgi:cytochrome c oxidase subunit 4